MISVKRMLLTGVVTTGLIAGMIPPGVHAEGNVSSKKQELENVKQQKKEAQETIDKLMEKIQPHKEKVEDLERKIAKTNKKIQKAEKATEKNAEKLKYYEEQFKNRVRLMYENGEMGSMRALFEAGSFGEFLQRFEVLRLILIRDRELFDKYNQIRQKHEELKKKHATLLKEQEKEAEDARKIYDKIHEEIEKTKKELASLSTKENNLQSQIDMLTLVDASLYPYRFASVSGVDPWGFYNRQCTSFVAWRINQRGYHFTNHMRGGHFGNATNWANNARRIGLRVNNQPAVGAIAQFNAGASGASGTYGHVAYVTAVNGSTITIEEYNYRRYAFSRRVIPANSVSNYIHMN
ncbi:CHAP domain-containing protein [Kroppenstedtia guangzhouensis]|nr:CHAP domain-containing protein [Kroppenstedtia guangzhouensis]